MRLNRRRIIFQLTPLVDLLLIVVFAQYLGLRSASETALSETIRRGEAALVAAQAEAFEAAAAAARTVADRDEVERRRQQLERELAAVNTLRARLEQEQRTLQAELNRRAESERALMRRHAAELESLGALAAEMLNIPEASLREALASLPDSERDAVLMSLEQLREAPARTIVHHLRRLNEVHKRADIWEIHVAGDDTVQLRLNSEVVEPALLVRSSEEFRTALEHALQTQPEPKGLVLLLLSWSNARWGVIADVQTGLEAARDALATRYHPSKRFEIGRLGYVPDLP